MPSTYTTNGGLELPANGEQSATWGSTVNTNMSIVDRLTNGVGSISLAGTTHTLTISNGTLSDGQFNTLLLGGSPTGTNTVTVTPNNGQHVYTVLNSSGHSAIFSQGSGANVTIPNGSHKIIYCDGSGSGASVVDITSNLDLASLRIGGTAVSATATELNILDGVTATTAEINILDGVTASASELNILDGVTATTAEVNFVDGVTSNIQTQLDGLLSSPTIVANPITIEGGTQNWTVTASGTTLAFGYNGLPLMKLDSSGNITVIGDLIAYGSI